MTAILQQPSQLLQTIKIVDMQQQMVAEAIKVTAEALKQHEIYTQIARHIKQHFDNKYKQIQFNTVRIGIAQLEKVSQQSQHTSRDITYILNKDKFQQFCLNLDEILKRDTFIFFQSINKQIKNCFQRVDEIVKYISQVIITILILTMGICPSLSPQGRVTTHQNNHIKDQIIQKLSSLPSSYTFVMPLKKAVSHFQPRYLYNENILEDIQMLRKAAANNLSVKIQSMNIDSIEDELKGSCLIMEDQVYAENNKINNMANVNESFQYNQHLKENQSLVCQINIIYQSDFDITKYTRSLKLFLKWSAIFKEHFYSGFMKKIYKQFCVNLYKMPINDINSIVDEIVIFVQFMVGIYTEIYHLKQINRSENGKLFKNQNVFNLVMAYFFRKTKIKNFIQIAIQNHEKDKIIKFGKKVDELRNKNMQFFKIQNCFQLKQEQRLVYQINNSQQNTLLTLTDKNQIKDEPYSHCIKLINNICDNAQTPITKLKIIVQFAKHITTQISQYYKKKNIQVPILDPDNLMSLTIYLIAKANRPQLYYQLKIAEYFSTPGALNCISGFYLITFNSAIQKMLTF